MNELIEMVGVTKAYDKRNVAVNNLTLTLPRGKIIGLLGPNGSGKTTMIKLLNGLLKPTQGSIKINGEYIGTASKARVAYLPDRTYLSGGQKITEILDFFCDFYEDFSREKAVEMQPEYRRFRKAENPFQRDERKGAADSGDEPQCRSVYS